AEEHKRGGYLPGYFRPQFDGDLLYARWGFGSVPRGVAAIDRATGRPLWSNESLSTNANRSRNTAVPLGDPVLVDGLLYYLQWKTEGDVNQHQGCRLNLVAFDPRRRATVWEYAMIRAGHARDVTASVEKASPQRAVYGNRVTVHQGSIYSNTNCGVVARSDIRDGRSDWTHHYRPAAHTPLPLTLGSPPLVAGDLVLCMPRDSVRVFALDRRTGRLVWENSLVLGVELIGATEDRLIVRGLTTLAGLDLSTGETRWRLPLDRPVLGRAALLGSSVYLAGLDGLRRLAANTGRVEETRKWNLKGEKPLAFAVRGHDLYVVTDKPAEDPRRRDNQPLNPSAPRETSPLKLPLRLAWRLPRDDARTAFPPQDSPLKGRCYLLSRGVLECIDVSAQGGVRWRRFISARDPTMHCVGKTLLVIDGGRGLVSGRPGVQATGLVNRVTAHDAEDGRFLWEHELPHGVRQTVNCGETQIFHDGQTQVAAVSLATGKRLWERHWSRQLGRGQLMRFLVDGTRLNLFLASPMRIARRLVLDAQTGREISRNIVELIADPARSQNGKAIKDGYYEVKFAPVRGRYLRLVALSEVNGGGWTSIAELHAAGDDGENIPRDRWKVHHVDGFESKARMSAAPENVFDDDPATWWHTPWIGGIPRHPHEIQIDLREEQTVTAIRYLPAVIINSNGMIKDYELYVSKDGKDWGAPVAKGVLINRPRVDKAYLGHAGIVFESHDRSKRTSGVYRCAMDGKPARLIEDNARLVFLEEPYFVTSARRGNEDRM
ncbi:MAG: PQQ-binding-like beta-propeller repeat protein, partial [Planctomycetales bacterium]